MREVFCAGDRLRRRQEHQAERGKRESGENPERSGHCKRLFAVSQIPTHKMMVQASEESRWPKRIIRPVFGQAFLIEERRII